MIITIKMLMDQYKKYADPKGEIRRDVRDKKLIPIIRGLYETNPNVSGLKLCQFIYGPSYVSFDYVLSQNGLIPETVFKTYTCATCNKRKTKIYKTYFGWYIYRDIPMNVYSYGVNLVEDETYSYHIATVEKALCDKLYTISPVCSIGSLEDLLFNDLRINRYQFNKLNCSDILEIADLYHSTNLYFLAKFIKKELKKKNQ